LIASRWWPHEPDERAWKNFQRSVGLAPAAEQDRPVGVPWRPRPWAKVGAGGRSSLMRHELRLVQVGAGFFSLLIAWQIAGLLQGERGVALQQEQIDRLEAEASETLNRREQALDFVSRAEQIDQLYPSVSQLLLLDGVTEAFPQAVELRHWRYEAGELRVTVEGERPDASQFVRSLQDLRFIEDVIAERGSNPNQLDIRAQVRPDFASGGSS